MSTAGYVVVEYNQASGMPDLLDLHLNKADARDHAAELAENTAASGRRERYRVAEVILLDDED